MVSGAGRALPERDSLAARVPIIVRFAVRGISRSLLTSAVSPVYWCYSPGGFARRAFSIPLEERVPKLSMLLRAASM